MNSSKINGDIVPLKSEKYQQASIKLRMAWTEYKGVEDQVKYEIIKMFQILEGDGYSRMDALRKIIADHKDLEGFSRATIYRQLPEDMKDKQLGRPNFPRGKLGEPNNNALEEFRKRNGKQKPKEPAAGWARQLLIAVGAILFVVGIIFLVLALVGVAI